MTLAPPIDARTSASPSLALAVVLIGALTILRYVGLHYSTVDLFFDESQYWSWSRDLAFGYFSKPPLLAWIIAASSFVCGDGEACARAASPIFYFATSLVIYAIADELYNARTAFWSALVFALLPGVAFSSRIISTDVPLLFFWALALLAYVKLLRGADWRWAMLLGLAFGIGLLAKYAMAYFLAGMVLAALIDRRARALLLRPQTWAALALALLILSPNVVWNMSNGFVTLKHTGDNIQGSSGLRFTLVGALEFLASQFGVVGPLVFGTFVVLLARCRGNDVSREDRLMLVFALPPLAAVTALGLFRGVNANWAAAAFVSLTVVVVAIWIRQERTRLLAITLAIGVFAQAVLLIGDVVAYQAGVAALGEKGDIYRRTLGWRGLGEAVRQKAAETGAKVIAAEGRHEVASLLYYLRDLPQPIFSWPVGNSPDNQFDMTNALTASAAEPILFISYCPLEARLAKQYREVKSLGDFSVASGPNSFRSYRAYLLAGSRGPVIPLGRCVN